MTQPDGSDRTAARLKAVLKPGQQAIGVAAQCKHCNTVDLIVLEIPAPISMGQATCHKCDHPILAVFGLGARDTIDGSIVKLAMMNAAVALGENDETSVGVSVGIPSDDPPMPVDAVRH